MAIQELEDIRLVDTREAARWERQQDVRVRAGRRPRHAFPPRGKRDRRALAALAVRAPRRRPQRGFPAAEPAAVVVGCAESYGKTPFPAGVDESGAPVRPGRGVGILKVRAELVRSVEYLP